MGKNSSHVRRMRNNLLNTLSYWLQLRKKVDRFNLSTWRFWLFCCFINSRFSSNPYVLDHWWKLALENLNQHMICTREEIKYEEAARKRLPMKLWNIANYLAYFEERLAKLLRYLFSDISALSKPGLNDKFFPEKVKNILEQLFFRGPHLCYNLSGFPPPPSPLSFKKKWQSMEETKEDFLYI